MPDIKGLIRDPEFQKLPFSERQQLLSEADPDFGSAPADVQVSILNEMKQQKWWQPKPAAPAVSTSPLNDLSSMTRIDEPAPLAVSRPSAVARPAAVVRPAVSAPAKPSFQTVDGAGGVIDIEDDGTFGKMVKPVPALAASQVVQGVGGKIRQFAEDPISALNQLNPVGAVTNAILQKAGVKNPTLPENRVSRYGKELAQEGEMVQKQIETENPLPEGSVAASVRSGLASTYQQLPAVVGGFGAGRLASNLGSKVATAIGTAVSLIPMGEITEGSTYQRLREKGFDPGSASTSAYIDKVIEVGTEALPTSRFLNTVSGRVGHGLKSIATQFLKYGGEEYVGESIATVTQRMNEKFMDDPNLSTQDRIKKVEDYLTGPEVWKDLAETIKTTTVQNIAMGALGMAGRGAVGLSSRRRDNDILTPAPTAPQAPPTIDDKAHAAATSPLNDRPQPTEAQINAGNYKHGDDIKLPGLPAIKIENPQGSIREGVDPDGTPWANMMMSHYGRFKATEGRDKQGVDVFLKPGMDEKAPGETAFVIDQIDPKTGKLDEHKIMIGYSSPEEAEAAYLANYDETGPTRIGAVTATTLPEFSAWLKAGNTKQAFAQDRFDKKGNLLQLQGGDTNGETIETAGTEDAANAEGQDANEGRQEGLLRFDILGLDQEGNEITLQVEAADAQQAMDKAEMDNPGFSAESAMEGATLDTQPGETQEAQVTHGIDSLRGENRIGNTDVTFADIPFERREFVNPNNINDNQTRNVSGSSNIIDYGGRKLVVAIINGVRVPFYLSTGRGGKADVTSGKWYPVFGIGADGWLNKTSGAEINSYYGSEKLKNVAAWLDNTVGDIRNDNTIQGVGATGNHFDAINEGLAPTENKTADTMKNLRANIDSVLNRLENAGQNESQVTKGPDNAQTGAVQPQGNVEDRGTGQTGPGELGQAQAEPEAVPDAVLSGVDGSEGNRVPDMQPSDEQGGKTLPVKINESMTYQGTRQAPLMGANDVNLVAKDDQGNDIGRIWYTKKDGGIEIRKIEVDPAFRRRKVATQLRAEAEKRDGKRLGSTDQTPEGKAFTEAYDKNQRKEAPDETTEFQAILDSFEAHGYVTKGKGKKNFYTDSDFQKHVKMFYPSVHGESKRNIIAALKAAIAGKKLTAGQEQIIENFRYDMEGLKQTAAANEDRAAFEARVQEVAQATGTDTTAFSEDDKRALVEDYEKWQAEQADRPGGETATEPSEETAAPASPLFEQTEAGEQGKMFATPPTFGKGTQGKGVVDENPMEAEIRERKAEKAQTGFSFDDTGGYADRERPTRPSSPTSQTFIELPEMVELAKAINEGKLPQLVKNIARGVLGRFSYKKLTREAWITLRKDLFAGPMIAEQSVKPKDMEAAWRTFQFNVTFNNPNADIIFRKDYNRRTGRWEFRAYDKDPDYVLKTLAHEIGHNVDYLPDGMVKGRGNIFGHIAALKNYTKEFLAAYEGAKGQPLTKEDRERLMKEARATTPKGEDIVTTITREVPRYEEAGITPEMIRAIWQDVNGRDKYPELYLFIAKMSDSEKKAIVVQAMKGIVDARLNALKNRRQVGVDTVTETIVTPAKQRPEAVAKQFEKLLRDEIQKRRLYEKEVVMEELKAVTQAWKPFDPAQNPEYTKYRYSSAELYADAVSVLVNDPQLLKDTAPTFYKAFLYYAKERPEFRDAYRSIMRLSRDPERLQADRYAREMEMYQRGHQQANQLREQNAPDERSIVDTIMRGMADRNWDILKQLPEGEKGDNVRYALEEIQYLGGEIGNYVRNASNTRKALEEAGATIDDLGAYLLAKHIISNRDTMANTQGKTAATEQAKLDWMRRTFGPEKFAAIERAATEFRENREYILDRIEQAGIVTPELMALIRSNTDYAHIDVQEYMDQRYGAGTAAGAGWKKHAEGTLKDVTNPFIATVIQDMSILRMAKINEAKRAITDVFEPAGMMTPAEMKWDKNTNSRRPVEPKEPGKALLTVLKNGKPVYYVVDKHVADTFTYDPIEAHSIGRIFGYITQFFRDVLVSKNPAWMTRNIYRDFKGTVKNNPEVAWWNPKDRWELIKAYKEAFKEVYKDVFKGERSEDIEAMYRGNMLNQDRMFSSKETTFDDELTRIAMEFHFGEQWSQHKVFRAFQHVYRFLDKLGQVSEKSSKVAGYKYLSGKGVEGKTLAHRVRTRIGTPDYRRQGGLQRLTNNVFIFSNVNKEGIRSAVEAAKEDPMSYAMKTISSNVLPKLLLGIAAAGFFGDEIKKIVEKIPSWDRRTYNVIPLPNVMTRPLKDSGIISEDAAVYLRLPQDYEGMFFGAIAYDLVQGDMQGVFQDIKSGQPYRAHPVIEATLNWALYLGGANPTDSFRQRDILTREQQDYHRIEGNLDRKALEGMGKYTWNVLGLGGVYRMDNKEFPKDLTVTEKSLKAFPLNAVGTYLTVTDMGHQEQLRDKIMASRDKKTIASYEVGDRINAAVKEGKTNPQQRRTLYNELKNAKMIDPKTYTYGRFNNAFGNAVAQRDYGIKPSSKKELKILQEGN